MSQSSSNENNSNSNKQPNTSSEQTGGSNELVQGLSNTAETIGASLQAMQTVLVGNMQQAAQMTLSMNKMMEELVKRSVQVSVFAHKRSNISGYQINLRIAISNRSPIPLQNAHVRLWFCPRQILDKYHIRMRVVNKKDNVVMLFKQSIGDLPDKCDGMSFTQTEREICVDSGSTTETELELEIDRLQQLNGRIALEFISPGTGQQLSVSHRFGIHLLQLADCFFARNQSTLEDAELSVVSDTLPVNVDIARMRSIFGVPPADGIDIGCLLVVRTHEFLLALRVVTVLPNARTAICEWLATTPTVHSDTQDLIQHLVEELSTHDNILDCSSSSSSSSSS
ncbi:hypothetical protein COEREDRAFT_13837 [Coemansia reversa NRRL 1564]|uniref:Uncharacterized protein n=1 Tax=Coemansia reversa (strain ATCC 12441 / NRRL 1564) TaxID=763665 RepID=A0A2G5BGX9_COERN|nr:hypothetical protein COEREDRAFT_13837 [Coemansia reversa NRRL 1564]|eukprot:PIA18266.1 hypothetical protein COEREDRAFT_13837 [Coemansia reversa NRRL 1564]